MSDCVFGPIRFVFFPDPLVIGVVLVARPHHRLRRLGLEGQASSQCLVVHLTVKNIKKYVKVELLNGIRLGPNVEPTKKIIKAL